jgi:hypothetical protein
MKHLRATTKRLQIDRANAVMVTAITIASFAVTFSLVAARTLMTQQSFQAKVIKEKETARNRLESNLKAASQLETSYKEFTGAPANVLGGNPSGQGDRDGDNGKIILDALPSKYDYPALATSIEKLLLGNGFALKSIAGTDDEAAQNSKQDATATGGPVDMPFTASAEGNFGAMHDITAIFERSIRPFQFRTMLLEGDDTQLTMTIDAKSFYQPAKNLDITTKAVQ